MARVMSWKRQAAMLSSGLREDGRTWAEIAVVLQERYGVTARAALRLAHGWSQIEAARRWCERWPESVRTSKDFSAWEVWPESRSGRAPDDETIARLAELYDCDAADVLSDVPALLA